MAAITISCRAGHNVLNVALFPTQIAPIFFADTTAHTTTCLPSWKGGRTPLILFTWTSPLRIASTPCNSWNISFFCFVFGHIDQPPVTFPVSRIQTEGINSFVVHCFLISCDVSWTSRTWILRVSSLLGSLPFNECINKLLFTFVRVNNKASSLHLYSGILRIFKSYRIWNTQHQEFPKNRLCCHAG